MSVTTTQTAVVLEPASQQFVEATARPPFLYELTPTEARAVLDDGAMSSAVCQMKNGGAAGVTNASKEVSRSCGEASSPHTRTSSRTDRTASAWRRTPARRHSGRRWPLPG